MDINRIPSDMPIDCRAQRRFVRTERSREVIRLRWDMRWWPCPSFRTLRQRVVDLARAAGYLIAVTTQRFIRLRQIYPAEDPRQGTEPSRIARSLGLGLAL
jgi:hypothetical protein